MTTTAIIVALFIVMIDSAIMSAFFEYVTELGYFGALLAGIFFASILTTPAAVVMLFELGQRYNVVEVAFIAALGSILTDFLILNLFEDQLVKEFNILMKKIGAYSILRALRRKRMRGLLVIAGIGIIGSPLPDELGLGILDISHLPKYKIIAICFVANFVGTLTIVSAGFFALNGV